MLSRTHLVKVLNLRANAKAADACKPVKDDGGRTAAVWLNLEFLKRFRF